MMGKETPSKLQIDHEGNPQQIMGPGFQAKSLHFRLALQATALLLCPIMCSSWSPYKCKPLVMEQNIQVWQWLAPLPQSPLSLSLSLSLPDPGLLETVHRNFLVFALLSLSQLNPCSSYQQSNRQSFHCTSSSGHWSALYFDSEHQRPYLDLPASYIVAGDWQHDYSFCRSVNIFS